LISQAQNQAFSRSFAIKRATALKFSGPTGMSLKEDLSIDRLIWLHWPLSLAAANQSVENFGVVAGTSRPIAARHIAVPNWLKRAAQSAAAKCAIWSECAFMKDGRAVACAT
jgi:hypothetical protein